MRRYFLAAFIILLLTDVAQAWQLQKAATATSQLLIGGSATATVTTADKNYPIGYYAGATTGDYKSIVFPVAGTLTSLRFYTTVAPTGTQTWSGTFVKSGVSSALACTVNAASSPTGTCTATGSISVAAGDWGSLLLHSTNTPSNTIIYYSFVFVPTTPNDTIIPSFGNPFSTTLTWASYPFSTVAPSTVAARLMTTLPDSGTIDRLQVASNAPGAGTSYDYTADKNGSLSSPQLTCQIAGTATSCGDITHSFTVVGGDNIEFQGAPTNTPVAGIAGFGVRYLPTTVGSYALMVNGLSTIDSGTVTTFYPVSGGNAAGGTTEANAQSISDTQTITAIRIKLPNAPGGAASGKKRTFKLNVNGVASVITCDVIETATTNFCNGFSVAIAANALLSTADIPANTPATGSPVISYLAHR